MNGHTFLHLTTCIKLSLLKGTSKDINKGLLLQLYQ
jgi:hypothetical protein